MSGASGWLEVAPGYFQIAVAGVNCFLIRRDEGLTLIDAGLPGTRGPLHAVLRHLGARPRDIDALGLTHGHFDHVGMAREIRGRGTPVLVHSRDAALAKHPYRYRPAVPRVPYLLSHPGGLPIISRMALKGALMVRGVEALGRVYHGHPVDAPGAPIALWTPGHTAGHCAYFFADDGILISGDALVTLDPYTGETGPQIVARAATADGEEALRALGVLAETSASLVLPGHGTAYPEGIISAVARADESAQPALAGQGAR